MPTHRRTRNRLGILPIRHRYRDSLSLLCCQRTLQLQEVLLVESIECPEHLVTGFGLELAAADGSELVIDQKPPELGRRLCRGADRGDKKILEFVGVGAVEAEAGDL